MNLSIFNNNILPIQSKLYRFALRITGNSFEAEDVVQEVMEKVWKVSGEQEEKVQNWEAWCMTLTRNRSIDKARSTQSKRTSDLAVVHGISSNTASPEQQAVSVDTMTHIKQFMQELPDKQKMVMHLRDIEEMTYEEIASTLDMTLDQVKVNLHRARKAVREKISNLE